MAPKSLVLTYFPARGRAERIRWVLAVAKAQYTEKNWTGPEFQANKSGTPFGQLPVLEVDGKQISQSWAILNYIAREYGLLGANSLEDAEIGMVTGCLEDTLMALFKTMFGGDDNSKAQAGKDFSETHLPKFLEFLNKRLTGKQFLVGSKVSLADITTACFLHDLAERYQPIVAKYPTVQDLVKKVTAIPELAAYISKRRF